MIKYKLILFFFFLVSFAQAQLSKETKLIDGICNQIDKDTLLKKKILKQEQFMEAITDNGGSLTIYHKKNIVFRITEWVGLSNKVIINNYYFQNGKLIFVSAEELMYERNTVTGEITGTFSKDNRFFGQYYFKSGKLFDEESLGHNRFEDDEHYNAEKEFINSAKKFLNLFYRRQ